MSDDKDHTKIFTILTHLTSEQGETKNAVKDLSSKFQTFQLGTVKDVTELKTKTKITAGITAAIITILTSSVVGGIITFIIRSQT
jgi:hypothetical protein